MNLLELSSPVTRNVGLRVRDESLFDVCSIKIYSASFDILVFNEYTGSSMNSECLERTYSKDIVASDCSGVAAWLSFQRSIAEVQRIDAALFFRSQYPEMLCIFSGSRGIVCIRIGESREYWWHPCFGKTIQDISRYSEEHLRRT